MGDQVRSFDLCLAWRFRLPDFVRTQGAGENAGAHRSQPRRLGGDPAADRGCDQTDLQGRVDPGPGRARAVYPGADPDGCPGGGDYGYRAVGAGYSVAAVWDSIYDQALYGQYQPGRHL